MRFAVAVVVLALASPARAECPDPGDSYATAIVADGDSRELVKYLDGQGFGEGECNYGAIGLVIAGTSIRVPMGPLSAISASSLQGGPGSGTIVDATWLAIAQLERTGRKNKWILVVGHLPRGESARLQRAADAAGVEIFEEQRVEGLQPLELPSAPLDPINPKWPALALLGLAALIARRTFRA